MQASQWAMRAKVAMRRRRTAAPYSEYLSIFLATLTRRRSRAVFRRPMRVVVCRLGRNHCKARRRHDKALLYCFHWDLDSPRHQTFPIMVGKKLIFLDFGESWKFPKFFTIWLTMSARSQGHEVHYHYWRGSWCYTVVHAFRSWLISRTHYTESRTVNTGALLTRGFVCDLWVVFKHYMYSPATILEGNLYHHS